MIIGVMGISRIATSASYVLKLVCYLWNPSWDDKRRENADGGKKRSCELEQRAGPTRVRWNYGEFLRIMRACSVDAKDHLEKQSSSAASRSSLRHPTLRAQYRGRLSADRKTKLVEGKMCAGECRKSKRWFPFRESIHDTFIVIVADAIVNAR